ncbi:manganese/iron superoxide dismutase [Kipferlia bialata]|uniref:superoxide dismutase n=1 Tax=Kipferlia bialata TaxID=797122 RepID=A0A9K3CWI1_9EUKA|nr:manganese/iron superoxide dismutase [Kipferlia bialata]GIQ82894.1 manganese/iron superoxide dismutase [Kipferlia bialata]GIQ85178.1 manganese/iron superoxide dismutase [Kipferlia bialata]|eukprot:g4112.t1
MGYRLMGGSGGDTAVVGMAHAKESTRKRRLVVAVAALTLVTPLAVCVCLVVVSMGGEAEAETPLLAEPYTDSPYSMPPLPYALDALESAMSAHQLDVHYNQHHRGYCTKINALLEADPISAHPIEYVLEHIEDVPVYKRQQVINFGGGYANHSFFWESLSPTTQDVPLHLVTRIEAAFMTPSALKREMVDQGMQLFGSGWVWLVERNGRLEVVSTMAQDRPEGTLLLALDVWEHAYYLDYESSRLGYLEAIWGHINWTQVDARLLVTDTPV